MAIDGGRIVVGAPAYLDGATGFGSAFAYEFDGNNWVELPELFPPTAAAGDAFGASVDFANGFLAIGAPDTLGAGRVHVFEPSASGWSPSLEL